MTLPVPVLDDRTYEQLFNEAKNMIPRYFPGWTDHNLSDPGITLIELFSMLMEICIYQTDRIPENTYRHFAQMIGGHVDSGEPAHVSLKKALNGFWNEKQRVVTYGDFKNSYFEALIREELNYAARISVEVTNRFLSCTTYRVVEQDPFNGVIYVQTRADSPSYPEGSLVSLIRPSSLGYQNVLREDLMVPEGNPVMEVRLQEPFSASLMKPGDLITIQNEHENSDYFIRFVMVPELSGSSLAMSEEDRQKIYSLLKKKCPIATRISVVNPLYEDVCIKAVVVRNKKNTLKNSELETIIKNSLTDFASPLKGGADGRGWPFGRPLYRSELYNVIEKLDDVDHVRYLCMKKGSSPAFTSRSFEINTELLLTTGFSLINLTREKIIVEITDK